MHYPEHLKQAVLAKAKDLPRRFCRRTATAKSDADWEAPEKKKLKKTYHL